MEWKERQDCDRVKTFYNLPGEKKLCAGLTSRCLFKDKSMLLTANCPRLRLSQLASIFLHHRASKSFLAGVPLLRRNAEW